MRRNIFIYVLLSPDGRSVCTSVRLGNSKVSTLAISCIFKTASPHLQFFKELRSDRSINLKEVKVISFNLAVRAFQTFTEFYEFRQKCYEFCRTNGIFFFSPRQSHIEGFMALSQTQTMVNEGEKVTVFRVTAKGVLACTYIREKNHFRGFYVHSPCTFAPTLQWKQKFMNGIQPEKIIFLSSLIAKPTEVMKKLFGGRQQTLSYTPENTAKAVAEMAKHAMGEKISQYYIQEIFGFKGVVHDDEDNSYIDVIEDEALPFEKSVIINVNHSKTLMYTVYYYPETPGVTLKQIKFSSLIYNKVEATLKIDANGFYDFSVVPCIEKEKLVEKMSKVDIDDEPSGFSKARITFDKQHFTVFIGDDNKMEVVKDVDGHEKIPIYIAFMDDPKPKVGNIAKEYYSTNSKAVVFDLVKLCSISTDDVMSPKWGFKLEKEDNALMVKVDTVDGEKQATVDFFLALIFKHALKIIKDKTGKKEMDKIEIGFDGFTPNEMLKKNFEKAGKLKDIDVVFV